MKGAEVQILLKKRNHAVWTRLQKSKEKVSDRPIGARQGTSSMREQGLYCRSLCNICRNYFAAASTASAETILRTLFSSSLQGNANLLSPIMWLRRHNQIFVTSGQTFRVCEFLIRQQQARSSKAFRTRPDPKILS